MLKAIIVIMKDIYESILKLKYFCQCHESRISSSCQITLAELRGIKAIEEERDISCSDFSKRINLSPSRGSRIIDSLVRKGFLSREIKDSDRRSTYLSLTNKGKKIKKEIGREQNDFELILETALNNEDMELIRKGLKILEKLMETNIIRR